MSLRGQSSTYPSKSRAGTGATRSSRSVIDGWLVGWWLVVVFRRLPQTRTPASWIVEPSDQPAFQYITYCMYNRVIYTLPRFVAISLLQCLGSSSGHLLTASSTRELFRYRPFLASCSMYRMAMIFMNALANHLITIVACQQTPRPAPSRPRDMCASLQKISTIASYFGVFRVRLSN